MASSSGALSAEAQVVPVPPGVGEGIPDEMDPAVKPPPAPITPSGETDGADDAAQAPPDLDTLFKKLADAKSASARARVVHQIQVEWSRSESPTIDLLMARAHSAIQNKAPGLALDLLDAVVRFKPDFVAGWNRRAAAYFLSGDIGKALVDVERALALEPRHWGALAGLAAIQQSLGDDKAALATYERILEIYPEMDKAEEARKKLSAKTEGRTL
ncbi:tetratricopeptide repeat protein [Breoghania sp. L-A4]|uniref:tetratricopeptide repeat protein n=1 Tax=Breoghania sp. L-A4 TaxID=2304600 RepID=UPI0013C2F757|nr:tetratricopeptide repeat protein [Breoghania sp. L-A4]